jgi:hypothetical protein
MSRYGDGVETYLVYDHDRDEPFFVVGEGAIQKYMNEAYWTVEEIY